MLVNNDHRYQYLYFFLSGLVASAIIVLIYISVATSLHDKLLDDLQDLQRTLTFIKPTTVWNYNNTWRPIGNATQRHVVYSAYFDTRTNIIDEIPSSAWLNLLGTVRIFAILPTNLRDKISCIVRYDDFTSMEWPALQAHALLDHHGQPSAAYAVICGLLQQSDSRQVRLPQAVALAYASNRLSRLTPSFVAISYPRNMDQLFARSRPVLSVCVAPLQLHSTPALRLVEFVEMYRILGATHFYFYRTAASAEVLRVLEHYRTLGLADVLDWNLDAQREDLQHAGIVAQYNECVYRAMVVDNYRYAALLDLDEILVPFKHNSLLEFLQQCDEGRTAAFVFRNVFYYMRDHNDTFSVPLHARNRFLYTQMKVRRTQEVLPGYVRSKCVVNTRGVVEMANHHVGRLAPGYVDNVLHASVALLFHYRDKCVNCRALLVVDYTARRFGSLIWDQVDETCLQVFMERAGLCPAL